MSKIQIIAYFDVDLQNLMKIGLSAAELLRIFDFQNGDSPPSCIWCVVISDRPRLGFAGPNILLKLHVDRVYTRDVREWLSTFPFPPIPILSMLKL